MKTLALCIFLFVSVFYFASVKIEPGVEAVFKLKPEYRHLLSISNNRTGINELDSKLDKLRVSRIKQRFLSPKNSKHEIALIFTVYSDLPPQAVVNLLGTDKHVQYAEVVYPDEIFAVPNDPSYSLSEYLPYLEAEAAWDIHKGELGANPVILAIVDTGVKWDHVDLAENIWNNLGEDSNGNGYTMYHNGSAWVMDSGDINGIDDDANGKIDDLIGWDFMLNEAGDEATDPYDSGGHGTAVSGLMAARTNNGVGTSSLSWNLTLMPISCSHVSSSIYRGYEGIVYAAENGADVINCSWGGNIFSMAAQEVINYAWGLGSIIVAAAGNSNNQNPVYPAAYRNVLATAALLNTGVKSTASSYGAFVDFGATNSRIYTTTFNGGYALGNTGTNNATSYASPLAVALVGLVKSYYPALSQADIVNRVKGSCDDIELLNPSYPGFLGEGKLNARRALEDLNPLPDNEARVALQEFLGVNDSNANEALEPGETFSLNLRMRNYGYAGSNAVFTLSTSSTAVSILSNTEYGSLPEDDYFELSDAFSIYVLPGASSQYVTFTLHTSSDISVAAGANVQFSVVINNGGVLIWESVNGGRNMSGSFIRTTLQGLGYTCVYGNSFPQSMLGFDAAFLSFGTPGSSIARFDKPYMFRAVKDYLETGGKLYLEGGDVIGYDMAYLLPEVDGELDAHEVLWPLLGIDSADDGASNTINGLWGAAGSPADSISFASSTQTVSSSIDIFSPNTSVAKAAFTESDYGYVAVANTGDNGQRSFVFSYALRELVDGSFPNTRANLVEKIMDFFEGEAFMGLLDVPQLLVTEQEGEVLLSWEAIPNADYYLVYVSDVPDNWAAVSPIIVYDLQYQCSSEEKQFFRVKAYAD